MQETILVTGATGIVGSEVIKALSTENVKVRAGVHNIIKGERFKVFPNVDLVEIDFSRPESLTVAYTGVTKVFQITPFIADQVNVGKQLIDVAKRAGVKQIVKLSASGADAEPGIQLGREHREVEKYLEASGIPYVFLRPASFMQNFINYNRDTILNESKIYAPLGQGKVGYIDAHDIAAVAKVVLTQPDYTNQALELTGPEALSMPDIATALSEITGRTITYVDVSEKDARQEMSNMQMPNWMVDALIELNNINKAGFGATITDTVEKVTGQTPRTFRQFAQENSSCFVPE